MHENQEWPKRKYRPKALLEILTENVHLDEKYMIGGMKTEAGKDRIIPLNDKLIPLVKNRYDPNKKYLINNKFGTILPKEI